MICLNCGNEIRDDAKFCPNCGAMNGGNSSPGVDAPWESHVEEGKGGGKKKIGLIIGAAVVAVIAAVVVVMVLVGGVFSSPKKAVEKAFAKTVAAYEAVDKKLGIPDLNKLNEERNFTQRLALELTGTNSDLIGYDLSALNGLGLRVVADYDGKGRKMDADLAAYWNDDDIISFQMLFDGANLYLGSPQFIGDTLLGVNTETLGDDLAELSGDDSVADISFNFFDLVEKAMDEVDPKEMEKRVKEANKALFDSAEVKKAGTKTMDINGTSTKTKAYQMTIPQEAVEDYVDAMADIMSSMNYIDVDFYEDMLQSMGMPREQIDDFMYEMEELDIYGELADMIKDGLDELGDLELDVCLSDGYVSALVYETRVQGSQLEIALYLGGGKEYVDDLSLEIEADGGKIEVQSTGDHSLKGGVYVDETTVRVQDGGSTLARVTSELSYDPKGKSDNFRWKLGVDSSGLSVFVLETEGALTTTKDSIDLKLDDVSVRAVGMEICSLGFEYYMGPCQGMEVSAADSLMLADMDRDDLMDLGRDIEKNAERWMRDMKDLFTSKLPTELLWFLMYSL